MNILCCTVPIEELNLFRIIQKLLIQSLPLEIKQ